MPSLLRISEASWLGLHVLTFLAVHPGKAVSAPKLARACSSSAQHMAKVCRRLAKAGFLLPQRGKQGGFRLGQNPSRVRLSQVLSAFGEALDAKGCVLAHAACGHSDEPACIFGPELNRLQKGVSAYFRRATLAQLARRCAAGARP